MVTSGVERGILGYLLADGAEARGRHACGYAAYDRINKQFVLEKAEGTFKDSELLVPMALHTNVIGHTRFATVGAHTKENAHPFHYKQIIGAHNGGIYNYEKIAEKYNRDFKVDSQHLIAHIAERRSVAELTGYGAVTWFNTKNPGIVYLCRMKNGDLVAEVMADRGVVWASTTGILSKAMGALKWYTRSKQYTLDEGCVYKVEDGRITKTKMILNLDGHGKKAKHTTYTSKGTVTTWYGHGGTSYTPPKALPAPKASATVVDITTGKVQNPEVIGSAVPRRSHKSRYEREVEEYNASLDHYTRAVQYGAGVNKNAKATEASLTDICGHQFPHLSFTEFEEIDTAFELTVSRRQRRRWLKKAKAIVKHSERCSCKKCMEIEGLFADLTSIAKDGRTANA